MKRADETPDGQVLRYVARFDRREFWLAHEELEELWQDDRRDFYRAMIQVAAAFVHIERANWRGARRLLATALLHMDGAENSDSGFDVAAVRERTAAVADRVQRCVDDEATEVDESLFFTLQPHFARAVPENLVEAEELPYRVRRYEEGYRPVRRGNRRS